MQQHSARTRLRSKHRVIPSMFLQNVITELEEAAVMSELQQTDRKNVSIPSHQAKNVKQTKISGDSEDDDDEDDEFNRLDEFGRTKNLDYRFTTQFDDAKKHTRDIFNKVRTAEKVIHNFVTSSPNQYVYGQTLHGGGNNKNAAKGRKLDLANASRRLDANKKALLSESGEVRFANIDDILRDEDLAEMEQSYDANQDDDDHEVEGESGDENNDDENDEEEQDDEVQRLLGDDWRNDEGQEDETGENATENMNNKKRRQKSSKNAHSLLPSQNKSSPSNNAAASIPILGSKRRRLPDLLDVANQVTRRNRAISLLQVSRAMSLQTDNKKAKTMIHFQGGSLLSQRRDIMELQNELQNQIEDGGNNLDSNFIRTGLVSSKCFTTSTDLRCTSREIMAEEYFNPSRNGVFAITTTTVASRRRQQRQQQRKVNNSNVKDMTFGNGFGPVDSKNNDDEEDDDDDDEDEAEKQRSREEQNRISAKLDFLRAHKPEFLVEDSYRRIDAFIAAEDDNTVTSNLLEGNNNNNNNGKMLTPMDFLNNVSSTSPIISAPMYKSKFLQQRRAQQDAEYLLQMNNNAVKTDGDKSEKLLELSRNATTKKSLIPSTSTGGFISQATVQQALQQSQMDEEHERHLILRNEQQLCRSIIESYRQFHVLSVQPYLDAERRSVTLAKECQREIDSLEKKLRVGTHAKEEVTSASSENDDKKIGKKASTPTTVGKVSFLNTSKDENEKSANEKNDAESKNEKSSDAGNVNKENSSSSSSSTITPFKISTAGYSILNSLGEQMDKLRAEDLEEKEERRKRQKMLEEAEDHLGVKNTVLGRHQSASSILLKKMMQDDTEHHQSIVFRTTSHHATNAAFDCNNKHGREGDASDEEAHDDGENVVKDDPSRPPRRVKNTAMMEALRVAQNQQTALALSKLPQLSAFVTLIDDDSNAENADDDDSNNLKRNEDLQSVRRSTRSNSLFPTQSPQKPAKKRKINPLLLKYCEYAERFVETQNKERAAFEEKVQTYRLATQQKQQQKRQNNFNNQQLQPQSSSSTMMPSSPLFVHSNKIGSKNFSRDDQNNSRSEQESSQRDIAGNSDNLDQPANAITSTIFDDQGNVVASVEQCARLTSPPSCLVASKRWAESHRMLPSNAGGKLRSDMTGKLLFSGPTGGVLPIVSSSANNSTSEGENQTLHSSKMSSAGSSNVACYDIFYPRFVAFEEQNAREVRERNLMELQTRVSDISILSRDARLEAGKAKKGVVQCILQQMDLF